jgi:ferredoxin-NADP reductase
MMHELLARGTPTTLLYSVQHPAEATFLEELTLAARSANAATPGVPPAFAVVGTVTGRGEDGWSGRRGRISGALIEEAVADFAARDVYLCGPAAFMAAAAEALRALGHPRMDRVFTESFAF